MISEIPAFELWNAFHYLSNTTGIQSKTTRPLPVIDDERSIYRILLWWYIPIFSPVQHTIWLEQELPPTPMTLSSDSKRASGTKLTISEELTVTGLQVKPIGFPSGITPRRPRMVPPAVELLEITELQQ